MALSASVVWEVRPGTGSDTACSGGFDGSVGSPGTDYSQQASAQVSYTDLVIGATTTKLTSVLNPFTSAHVGNLIQVTSGSGFTTGFYTVLSVSAGTATMDRAVGTTASTGGNGYLGGALATLGKLFTSSGATTAPVGGNIVWLKGTLTVTAAIQFTLNSSAYLRVDVRGYGSTRGDGVHAAVTTATNSINMLDFVGVNGFEFQWIDFSTTAGTVGAGAIATGGNCSQIAFDQCTFSGFSVGINGNNVGSNYLFISLYLREVEITSCTSHGVQNAGTIVAIGCWFKGNGGDGVQLNGNNGGNLFCFGCVASGNTTIGFHDASSTTGRSNTFVNCAAYNNTTDGFYIGVGSSQQAMTAINNISYGNGGYGINFQTPAAGGAQLSQLTQLNNAFGSNTSGARNSGAPAGVSDVTLTANPFTAPSSGDFSLNSTAGGGAACAGAGWQSAII